MLGLLGWRIVFRREVGPSSLNWALTQWHREIQKNTCRGVPGSWLGSVVHESLAESRKKLELKRRVKLAGRRQQWSSFVWVHTGPKRRGGGRAHLPTLYTPGYLVEDTRQPLAASYAAQPLGGAWWPRTE